MNTSKTIFITATALLVAAFPIAAAVGSAAHPHVHNFYGVSATNAAVAIDETNDFGHIETQLMSSATVVGACADVSPVARFFPLPPEPVRDGDLETGVGGACFSFVSVYGDDTGTTKSVHVVNQVGNFAPVYVACVDVNGDGLCVSGIDEVNYCWTGPSGSGSISLAGGACTVYLNPAAFLNPYVYVTVVGAVDMTDGTFTADAALAGIIFYD